MSPRRSPVVTRRKLGSRTPRFTRIPAFAGMTEQKATRASLWLPAIQGTGALTRPPHAGRRPAWR